MDSLNILALSDFQVLIQTISKFYPCFWFGGTVHSEARHGLQPTVLSQRDSVFNIIFKAVCLIGYMEVPGQYRGHETRHDG